MNMPGLPVNAAAHGHQIDQLILIVHILMLVLFVGWGIYFIYTLCRFNRWVNPKAWYRGLESHTISSAVEISVIVIEAILLVGFSIPFWQNKVDAMPDRTDRIEVRVIAEQFAWNFHYAGEDGVFGKTRPELVNVQNNPLGLDVSDPHAADDVHTINQLNLPIGRPAITHITSKDVIHGFAIPVMRVRQDAIPGMSVQTWFTPTKTGSWEIACAQLCGNSHYRMRGFINVQSEEEFEDWLSAQSTFGSAGEDGEEYDDFWN